MEDIELFAPGRANDDTASLPFDYFVQKDDTPKLLNAGLDTIHETWMAPPVKVTTVYSFKTILKLNRSNVAI